jgi:hypothetical protein
MRLTDDRYTLQRRRLEVALRLIRHHARSSTIRECTGISEDRVRKLHRSYFSDLPTAPHRKRGKSPQHIHCLTRNLQARADAALLAGIFHSVGLLDEIRSLPDERIDSRIAARICDGYELFMTLRPRLQPNEFSFEHAWFLVRALARTGVIEATRCPLCSGMTLQDIYAPKRAMCPLCEIKRLNGNREPSRKKRRSEPASVSRARID